MKCVRLCVVGSNAPPKASSTEQMEMKRFRFSAFSMCINVSWISHPYNNKSNYIRPTKMKSSSNKYHQPVWDRMVVKPPFSNISAFDTNESSSNHPHVSLSTSQIPIFGNWLAPLTTEPTLFTLKVRFAPLFIESTWNWAIKFSHRKLSSLVCTSGASP